MSTLESFQKELTDVEKIYKETTGKDMVRFYRPPQGKYSKENLKMAQDLGYKTFFWSLAYVDWYDTDQPTKAEAFDKLLKRIHPGAIVLLAWVAPAIASRASSSTTAFPRTISSMTAAF